MEIVSIVNGLLEIIKGALHNISWIFTGFYVGDVYVTPILFVSFGVLSVLIPVAIVKWVSS